VIYWRRKHDPEVTVERLKAIRTNRLLTQKELAEKVGVSWQTVSEWESGRQQPRMSHLRKLCEVLEVTADELLSAEVWPAPKGKAA
jgi:transcriptional regulator with XRE-family HTH domain